MAKLHIKKGDTVYVNAGDDKGKTGRVLEVQVKKNRAIVEGINIVSKSTKPTAKYPQGGIVKLEAPVHISNLNVVDPKSGKPTRIGRRKNDAGKSCRRTKQYIKCRNANENICCPAVFDNNSHRQYQKCHRCPYHAVPEN